MTQQIGADDNLQDDGSRNPFRRLWQAWKRIAKKIANFQARVLLGIFYFVFLFPFALLLKWFADPLTIRRKTAPQWNTLDPSPDSHSARAGRQF